MRKLIPNSRLTDRYGGRARETIWRWKNDPLLNFPKPAARINNIDYFDEDELDAFDASTVEKHNAETA